MMNRSKNLRVGQVKPAQGAWDETQISAGFGSAGACLLAPTSLKMQGARHIPPLRSLPDFEFQPTRPKAPIGIRSDLIKIKRFKLRNTSRFLRLGGGFTSLLSMLLVVLTFVSAPRFAHAEPATRVYLNGVLTPVYFNDGDSFRVLAGPYSNTNARMVGFNALESYGAVHKWGDWKPDELYVLAKMAMLNAQRGTWACTSDGKRDTYDRILWDCKDLARDQIRKGLAIAMTVTEESAPPDYVALQQEAIAARRGIWAHGVPRYVLTSLHSIKEGGAAPGKNYNRLVSVKDGHSEPWLHNDAYDECAWICHSEAPVDASWTSIALTLLRNDTQLGTLTDLLKLPDGELTAIIEDTMELGFSSRVDDRALIPVLHQRLIYYMERDMLELREVQDGSCVLYVDFPRRFRESKASCLH